MYAAFLRKYIPIKWPEPKPVSDIHEEKEEEEEDKPITITIKKEELATSIQELMDTMTEEGEDAIDGIPLDHILEVLTAARMMLEQEEEELANQTCPVSAKDFAIKPAPEEKPAPKEEEWHVSGMKLPFAFVPEEHDVKPVEEKPTEEKPIEEKPVEEKPVEEKPEEEEEKPVEETPVEEKPEEEEWHIHTTPWALEDYPKPSVDWAHVISLLQQAKRILLSNETPSNETPTPVETTPVETPTHDETPTPVETPVHDETPIDWEHVRVLLREAQLLALQEKVSALETEKARLETSLEAEKAQAAQAQEEKMKAELTALAQETAAEVASAETTFTESFEKEAAQEKAAEVARVLATYRAEVKKHQKAYIERLDDFVYAKEMAVKGHFLAEEERLNGRWAERLQKEVANVTAEAEEEKAAKEAELAALQERVEALLEEMKRQEAVLRQAIRVQEYQQLLVTIQSRLMRQENVLPQLAQLVGAGGVCEA